MSDWELSENNDSALPKSDWEVHNPDEQSHPYLEANPNESYAKSAALMVPRMVTDLLVGGYNQAKKVPGYWDKAQTEIPGLYQTAREHPGHLAMQALAASQEAINTLAQAPLNLMNYGTNRLRTIPQWETNAVAAITPQDTSQAVNQLFGSPQYPGEEMTRGVVRNIPTILPIVKAAMALKVPSMFTTKNAIKNTLLNAHDALESKASNAFKNVSDQVNARGITQVPLTNQAGQPLIDFNAIRDYLPKTKQYATMLADAQSGDYNALRKLQTNLYEKGKKNLGSGFDADRAKGAEMLEKRNDVNQAISDHLHNSGNADLAETLDQARNDWRTLQEIYYNENMNNSLVNMFDKQYRKTPKNLINILSEESIPMKGLLDFHPGLEGKLRGYRLGQNVLGKSLKYGIPAGAALLGYEYGRGGEHGIEP